MNIAELGSHVSSWIREGQNCARVFKEIGGRNVHGFTLLLSNLKHTKFVHSNDDFDFSPPLTLSNACAAATILGIDCVFDNK